MTTKTKAAVTAEISKDGDRVDVKFDYDPRFVQLIKRVPSARFVPKEKGGPMWRLNLDLATMKRLREEIDPVLADGERAGVLSLGKKLNAWGHEEVGKATQLSDLSQADDAKLENVPQRMIKGCKIDGQKFKLRPYQKADIAFMAATNVINTNQPGAGKTIETIGALFEAEMEWGQHLVIAPVSSLRVVWEESIKHAYKCAGYDEPTILTGDTPKERSEAAKEAVQMAKDGYAFWLVLNPYTVRLKRKRVGKGDNMRFEEELVLPELLEVEWDSMTIDEFHLMGLSNPATMAARGVNVIAEGTQPTKKFALSGTPMGGKPIKLWGALHFLEPNQFTSRWHWARHWLVINNNGYGSSIEGIMPGREEDFYNHLKPFLVRRTKMEALPGLPPKQHIDVWCYMTPKQEEQYRSFERDAEWRIEDAEQEGMRLSATNILAMYTRLKQFASAYSEVHKTGKERQGVPELKVIPTKESGKIEQLMEKLREENVITKSEDDDKAKCALVFSQFNGMVKVVTDILREEGVPVENITGSTSGKKRKEIVDAFTNQTEGAARVLVMNTMAGGSALNLSQADTVHILDETWVPDNQEQAEDRAHRGDEKTMAKENVRMYYYRTRRSIEEYVRRLVADKQLNNKTILDLRRRIQKGLEEAEGGEE